MGDAVLGMTIQARGGSPKRRRYATCQTRRSTATCRRTAGLDLQTEFAVAYYTSYG